MADPIDERLREIREREPHRIVNRADIDFLLDQVDSLREVERAAREVVRCYFEDTGPSRDWDVRLEVVMKVLQDATHRPPLSGDGE